MPRTKDLVLFVVTIMFLLLAIIFTVAGDAKEDSSTTAINLRGEPVVSTEATNSIKEIDRGSVIERLREAIKNEETVIATNPVADMEVSDTEEGESSEELELCVKTGDDISFARLWPRENVELVTVEGVRMVAEAKYESTIPVTVSSTTASSTEVEPVTKKSYSALLTLPLYPTINQEPNCLTSDIVGVTADGRLLFNSDAIAYHLKGAAVLIGYARDGWPIYGNNSGEVDECGGAVVAGEYRYFLNSANNRVLSCYRGVPQKFVGE